MPSETCSTGMLDQFRWRPSPWEPFGSPLPFPSRFPFVSSEELLDISVPLFLVTDCLESRSTGCVLRLHVHDAVQTIFAFSDCRHHPKKVDLSAGRGNVRVITLRHQHAVALAHDLDQLRILRIG